MRKLLIILSGFALILAACSAAPVPAATPEPTAPEIFTPLPPTIPPKPTATPTPTATIIAGPFSKISRSTDVLHLKCDPLEIIFDVTANSREVTSVVFFFRMKDKASGLGNSWSNGENMRPAGNGVFEFILRASAIPNEARYKDAWVEYQFVGVNRNLTVIGQSRIFARELTFTPGCP